MRKISFVSLMLGLGLVVGCGGDDDSGGGSGGSSTGGSSTGGSTSGGSGGTGGSATGGAAGSATGGAAGSGTGGSATGGTGTGGSATGGTGGAGTGGAGTGGAGTGGAGTGGSSGTWTCTEAATSCTCTDVPGGSGAASCTNKLPCCFTFKSGQWNQCQCHNFTGVSCDTAAKAVNGTKTSKCPP